WRLSPDETRIAFNYQDDQGNSDVRIKDLPDGPEVRITFSEDYDRSPFWTPDGRSVTYLSRPGASGADLNVWSMRADGIGEPVLVLDDERSFGQGLWSPDGESLVLRAAGLSDADSTLARRAILAFRPGVDSAAVPLSLAAPEFVVQAPALSADGRWLAYQSNEGGEAEVFIRPFPDVNATKVRVSTEGGIAPVWAKNGSELFFIQFDPRELSVALIAAQIDPASGQVLDRQTLFTIPDEIYAGRYEPHSDGERFLMVRRDVLDLQDAAKFVVVLNWFEELKARVGN
ncbi:MAG: TolB family protein, partial [Gemmatimonadales bacterium]